jgi:hypothetical protein
MKKSTVCRILVTLGCLLVWNSFQIHAQENANSSLEGRWDMTIHMNGQEYPSWLEVDHSGFHTLVGELVSISGSARPISVIHFQEGKLNFSIPPQWESGTGDLYYEGKLSADSLTGTGHYSDGKDFKWTAHRAPQLKRKNEPRWGQPISLFNGKNLDGWHATGANQWVVEEGILRSPHSGANLVTDRTFTDFKLHIEFRYPAESNSGVYLRGRYEAQVEDSYGKEPAVGLIGAIYGFIAPTEMAAKKAGEWQSYDITLTGRMVTVALNGVTVICNREIPGITGGAIDSKEEDPGPLLIQGDHGPVDYRNVLITPAL